VLAIALSGCESLPFYKQPSQSVELNEQLLEQVDFYRPYEIYSNEFAVTPLGPAMGVDCQQDAGAADEKTALLALKADVYNLAGNAVILAHCQAVELPQCASAIQCAGEAFSIDPSRLEPRSTKSETPLDSPEIWF